MESRSGISIEEAMNGSDLLEIEVLRLIRIFIQNSKIMKKENDDKEKNI